MRIGLIGLGSIGERHARNIQAMYPKAQIEILTKRTSWTDSRKNIRLMQSPKEFYATRHDLYFITNETGKHAETILRCLKQKPKGIFVEKPLAHTTRDISRIRTALRKNPCVFFVGYCLQFSKPIQTMKREVRKGVLGSILFVRVSAGQNLRTWRKGNYQTHYSVYKGRGGGVTLDLIHELNYPAWILGEPLVFVSGISETIGLPIKVEDISEGIFQTKSGTIVSTHQDYLQIPGGRSCEIMGLKGTLSWDGVSKVRVKTEKNTRTIQVREDRNEMYKKELMWFISQVKKGFNSNFEEAATDVKNALLLKNV
jgi:predicted dehydrogenase